ncbi:hypothetical protein Poli38472_003696 [Pythium oligandrum]|uniref:Vacuolar protein 8 n=1 Tax=Pythium oligandrum TaxID=41045 RepID=A0A8K1CLP6_PYTOL|nr:hypothetical protein Poli38472_003696 [Pythium oligandrum]|eukprot:TMW65931.1 hypothetical protein Poli38472_003696 [Pythium oligandrum]
MLLTDAQHELSTALDVLYSTTQGRLLTHLVKQLTRLAHCEEALRLTLLKNEQLHKDERQQIAALERERDELNARNSTLQTRMQREKKGREEEKEWIAALWPDDVVMPTILRPYEPERPSTTRLVSQVEIKQERQHLQALVNRRVSKERVIQQLELATQWKVVVVLPTSTPEGERIPGQTYYQNAVTGESSWDAPIAMLYEPPGHWDAAKMDWKASYGLEHFYPTEDDDKKLIETRIAKGRMQADEDEIGHKQVGRVVNEDEDKDTDSEADASDDEEVPRNKASRGEDDEEDDDEEEDETPPADPVALREELTAAFNQATQLQDAVNKCQLLQRALAIQLLNATRENFEQEKEALAQEDEENKSVERKKRLAKQQEEMAAKAAAEAQERKNNTVQRKFAKDSVGTKGMTLAKDDELLEKELQEFVLAQRADRNYLAAPITKDARVKFHHQFDEEFVHMKQIEEQVLAIEQLEFDLLEKSALRHEEAIAKSEELKQRCEDLRARQEEVQEELVALQQRIAELEVTPVSPGTPRPTDEDMEKARERELLIDNDDDDNDEKKEEETDEELSREIIQAELGSTRMSTTEVSAIMQEEEELKRLKRCVKSEKRWKQWEEKEVLRLEVLAAAYDRFQILEAAQRRCIVDLALYEADEQYFAKLGIHEKVLNEMMWKLQADSQVARAHFLIERAAREESIFQVKDEYDAVVVKLDEARRLPRQARNPLEHVELLEASRVQAEELQARLTKLQERYAKEQEAKALHMALERRFAGYAFEKMQEELRLFTEKQALWDLNIDLQSELEASRDALERLHLAVVTGSHEGVDELEGDKRSPLEVHEDAVAVFDEKVKRVESVRQFLFLCYDREARWRALASIALIKDTTSDEWMTAMQHERQDQTLALLQKQHEHELQALQKEIKLLQKVQILLQCQLKERDEKIERIQHAYQASSDAVRKETEQIILGLKKQLELEELRHQDEQTRALDHRTRLIQEHEAARSELEQRVVALEDENDLQWHWLTSAKRELHAQRIANEELLMGYASLEKRRASETNEMRFRISSQIKKINNIEMWNLSLKIQSKEAHRERIEMQHEIERLVAHHKQQQRLLRLENWKHRVTAQAILTDVTHLFAFFAQGLAVLAGTTPQANMALRENGGIELLSVLAKHSCQSQVRVIAARALGQLAWNTNATPRALGWQAKHLWFQWQDRESTRVLQELASKQLEFDSIASEDSNEMNWLADTSHSGGIGETDADWFEKDQAKSKKKLVFLQAWNARDAAPHPDVNTANQEYIGLAAGVLKTLLDLCQPSPSLALLDPAMDETTQRQIQRNALRSLAITVMNTRNTAIIGRMEGCIPLLVRLIRAPDSMQVDATVARHAIHALANLAFQNEWNQTQICHHGAVSVLLQFCASHTDVDVLQASVQALVNLSCDHISSCEAIFDAQGIAILTRLCHSYRIHDAIDLALYEEIQSAAAEIISNVVTMLDADQPPRDPMHWQQQENVGPEHRLPPTIERNVAYAILAANELDVFPQEYTSTASKTTAPPGVATFVLMCASCNRDVAFHGALVLGSIAQHDEVRAAIGDAGGIDALFLLTDRRQNASHVAQATWALANLTWNRENQYRIARYLDALYRICTFRNISSENQAAADDDEDALVRSEQIREHGFCVLANALFYNDANRQLVASQSSWMTLIDRTCRHERGNMLEHAARALCSLSYSDPVALAMGAGGASLSLNHPLIPAARVNGLELFIRLCGNAEQPMVQKHGLYGVINMCLHDSNKSKLLEVPRGIETLVNLSGNTNSELCEPALEALDLLADLRIVQQNVLGSGPTAVLSPSTMSSLAATDLKKLIAILHESGDPALVAMASDAIADEVWKKPSAKVKVRNEHGLEKLMDLCVRPASPILHAAASTGLGNEPQKVLTSCLWALRNTIADNVRNQDYVGALDGIPRLLLLYDRHRLHEDVVEAILAVFVALVMKHPLNSQQLVRSGLDMLLRLAEGHGEDDDGRDEEQLNTRQLENAALARELLHLVAPYNIPPDQQTLPPLGPIKASGMSSLEKPSRLKKSVHLPPVLASSPLATTTSPTKRSSNN